jgi:predicted dehydrogenase
MRKIRWGVLGAAKIAINRVIPAIQRSQHGEVVAIASRDLTKARSVADQFRIPNAFGSYEQLVSHSQVDAVYVPLPNHLHVPWSLRLLEAGKHVLCEKPISLTGAEAQTLVDATKKYPHLKLMEAFMYRFHPQWARTKQLVNDGEVGALETIHSIFSYYNVDPNNIRNKADIGGGGLLDIGCYNISSSRLIFGKEPERAFGSIDYDQNLKTDRLASGILDFGTGTATFTCSTQLAPYQRFNIFGTEGRIELELPFTPSSDKRTKLWHQRGAQLEEITFDPCDQYTLQCEAFSLSILNDTPVPTPIEDARANMRVIEAVIASGKGGNWVRVH